MSTTWEVPGDFADIQTALASGSVVNGDTINWNDHTAEDGSGKINITKEITLTYTAAFRSGYGAVGGLKAFPTVLQSAIVLPTVFVDNVDNVTINGFIGRDIRFDNDRLALLRVTGSDNCKLINPQAFVWGHQLSVAPFNAGNGHAIRMSGCLNFLILGARLFSHLHNPTTNTSLGAGIKAVGTSTGKILNCTIDNFSPTFIGSFFEEGSIRLEGGGVDVTVKNTFVNARPLNGVAIAYTHFMATGGAIFNAASNNNAAADGSAPGAASQTLVRHANVDFYGIGAGRGDAVAGGSADGAGVADADLVGRSDIDGNPWPATPHIGAWAVAKTVPSIPAASFATTAMDGDTPTRTVMVGEAWAYTTVGEALDCLRTQFDVNISLIQKFSPEIDGTQRNGEAVLVLIDGDLGALRENDRCAFAGKESSALVRPKIWIQQVGTRIFKIANPAVKGRWMWVVHSNSDTDLDIAGIVTNECFSDLDSSFADLEHSGTWPRPFVCVVWASNASTPNITCRFRNNRILNFTSDPFSGTLACIPFLLSRGGGGGDMNIVSDLNYVELDVIDSSVVLTGGGAGLQMSSSSVVIGSAGGSLSWSNNTLVSKGLVAPASGTAPTPLVDGGTATARLTHHNNVSYAISGAHTEMMLSTFTDTADLANATSDTSAPGGTGFIHNLAGSAFVDDSDFEVGGGDFHPVIGSVLENAADAGTAKTTDIDGNPWINGANIGALNSIGVAPVVSTPPTSTGTLLVPYTLTDATSRSGDVTVFFSTDDGRTFQAATEGTGGDGTTGLDSSPGGTSHTFAWDSDADGVGATAATNVIFRIVTATFGEDESVSFSVEQAAGVVVQADAIARINRLLQIPFIVTNASAALVVTGLPSWAEVVRSIDGLSGVIQGIPPTDADLGSSTITIDAV